MRLKDVKDGKGSKNNGSLLSLVSLLALILFLLTTAPAAAQCTLSATGVSFGNYDVFSPFPLTSTGGITYSCATPDQTIEIHLGTGQGGGFQPRRMASGAERLAYNLYLDPAGALVWGDGTGGTSVLRGTTGPPGRTFTVTIYGRIPPGQDVAAGVYTDTIVVTLWF